MSKNLENWINPPPPTEEQIKREKENKKWNEKHERKKLEEEENRKKWVESLQENAKDIVSIGTPEKGEIWQRSSYLYSALQAKHENNMTTKGLKQWELLIDEFGKEVAENFRDGCINYWRRYHPFSTIDWRTTKRIPWGRTFGLMGLAMEAGHNPNWINSLSSEEATLATQYALLEMNGFPEWFPGLHKQFPDEVKEVFLKEIRYELSPEFSGTYSRVLQRIHFSTEITGNIFGNHLLDILESSNRPMKECAEYALAIILSSPIQEEIKIRLSTLARQKISHTHDLSTSIMWLHVLLIVNANYGIKVLKSWLAQLPNSQSRQEVANRLFSELGDDRSSHINAQNPEYNNLEYMEHLVPMTYQYIRFEDDIDRSGGRAYSPGPRDHAQRAREIILECVANTTNQKAYSLLLHWAKESQHQWHKDWLLRLAKNRTESDSEYTPWREEDIPEFAQEYEKLPSNGHELYLTALNHILDLKDDLEKGDDSVANSVRRIDKETELRCWLAREFRKTSNGKYEIAQEEEMTDDTRTDIRFRLPSITPVPIELKIADNCSFNDFFERMENQLIGQYMQASQYGMFLLVFRGEKNNWQDDDRKRYFFFDLIQALEQHAIELVTKYRNVVDLKVVGIDLTLRLKHKPLEAHRDA